MRVILWCNLLALFICNLYDSIFKPSPFFELGKGLIHKAQNLFQEIQEFHFLTHFRSIFWLWNSYFASCFVHLLVYPFWSIVYFWEMTRFWWNFWFKSGQITSFFCTHFQVHRTCFKKVKTKNAFFRFIKNAKNSSSQPLTLLIFFIFWIQVKTLDSYLFHYSKRDLESYWRF